MMADEAFFCRLFMSAQEGNWNDIELLFGENSLDFSDFGQPIRFNDEYRTILHYACLADDDQHALRGVELILNKMNSMPHTVDDLQNFVSAKDSSGETALDIAIRLGRRDITQVLAKYGATVDMTFTPKMSSLRVKVLLENCDKGIAIYADQTDVSDEYSWTLYANFGAFMSGNFCETKLLANVLGLPGPKRRKVLMHPLVQLFLYSLWEKFKVLLGISSIVTFLWCIMVSNFIIGTTQTNLKQSSCTHLNRSHPNLCSDLIGQTDYSSIAFYIIFSLFYILFLFSKYHDISNAPCKSFSLKRGQNWASILLLVVVPVAAITKIVLALTDLKFTQIWFPLQFFICLFCTIGIVAALIIVQGLLTRFDFYGHYNQMMAKSIRGLMRFLLNLGALLVSYTIFFTGLLPIEATFSSTFDTIMIGLSRVFGLTSDKPNVNDINVEANLGQITNIIPAFIVYASFMLIFMVLVLNLFVGLAVIDTGKSRQKAEAANVASCLESIYLMETFMKSKYVQFVLSLLCLKERLSKSLSVNSRVSTSAQAMLLAEPMRFEFKFGKIPKQIREEVCKITAILPKGYKKVSDEE